MWLSKQQSHAAPTKIRVEVAVEAGAYASDCHAHVHPEDVNIY